MARKFSFTMIDTFMTCPFKFRSKYKMRDPEPPPSEAILVGREKHTMFEDAFAHRRPHNEETQPYADAVASLRKGRMLRVEDEFGITREGHTCSYHDRDVFFRCKSDLLLIPTIHGGTGTDVKAPRNTSGIAYYLDWKTGKVADEKYVKTKQLEWTAPVIRALYPEITLFASRLVYTSHDVCYPKPNGTWFVQDAPAMKAAFEDMKKEAELVEAAEAQDVFLKKRSPLCRFCSARDCQFSENKV